MGWGRAERKRERKREGKVVNVSNRAAIWSPLCIIYMENLAGWLGLRRGAGSVCLAGLAAPAARP